MNNITVLNGSPRKNGNTSYLCNLLVEKLDNNLFKSKTFYLNNINIQACIDCRGCKKDPNICVIKDDTQEIYNHLDNSDFIIFGSPIYWYTTTAQLKLLIDRFRPYFANKRLCGKKIILILPAGSGPDDCDLTIEMFKRMSDALGLEIIGIITSKSFDIGDAVNDISANHQINSLAKKINQLN